VAHMTPGKRQGVGLGSGERGGWRSSPAGYRWALLRLAVRLRIARRRALLAAWWEAVEGAKRRLVGLVGAVRVGGKGGSPQGGRVPVTA